MKVAVDSMTSGRFYHGLILYVGRRRIVEGLVLCSILLSLFCLPSSCHSCLFCIFRCIHGISHLGILFYQQRKRRATCCSFCYVLVADLLVRREGRAGGEEAFLLSLSSDLTPG